MDSVWTKFASGVGFSKGCAALALVKPPPLVPKTFIAICVAMGPCAMVCVSTRRSSITAAPRASLTSWPAESFFATWTV